MLQHRTHQSVDCVDVLADTQQLRSLFFTFDLLKTMKSQMLTDALTAH